jgi:asparagine synthase (glutamine-hydrolysing)
MNYVEDLYKTLEKAVQRSIAQQGHFGLLFSGGLDSSLLTKICVDLGSSPVLISVHMAGSQDERHVRGAASFFDLRLIEKEIETNDVERYVKSVSIAASTKNPLDISIGVPIYAGLETAKKNKVETVMMGQGADELFGGYYRYLKKERGDLELELKKDVETINIARDIAISKACGVRLLVPYLDEEFVELGLRVPLDLKIKNGVRKHILREIAKRRGLPRVIWAREKKAIQYSTGVDKVVKKILKSL